MRIQRLIAVALSSTILSICQAAPAPFPKTESSAEVVLDARTPDRAKLALSYLRSDLFPNALHENDDVARALPHQTPNDRHRWLTARFSVSGEGTLLRIRLRDAGSLAVLEAITASLTRQPNDDGRPEQHRRLLRALRDIIHDREGKGTSDAQRGKWEVEDNPLRVQTAPKRLARGR